MSIAKYYLSQSGCAICADCAEQDEIESGKPLKERKNDTGGVLECTGCREDIPFVGQAYKARPSLTAEQWDELLDPDGLSKEGQEAWNAYIAEEAKKCTYKDKDIFMTGDFPSDLLAAF